MSTDSPSFIITEDKRRIAYCQTTGLQPGVIFLGGFMSDMTGTKSLALETWCKENGEAFTRFDYTGHGASSGRFEEGTIGDWLDDAVTVVDEVTTGPQILIGSSMGGWISLLLALKRPERIAGVITIACATDFIDRLLRPALNKQQLSDLETAGVTEIPTEYQEQPYRIGKALLESAEEYSLLNKSINVRCPVSMIHGTADTDVPIEISKMTIEKLVLQDVSKLIVIDGGDHRLSQPEQISIITNALNEMLQSLNPSN